MASLLIVIIAVKIYDTFYLPSQYTLAWTKGARNKLSFHSISYTKLHCERATSLSPKLARRGICLIDTDAEQLRIMREKLQLSNFSGSEPSFCTGKCRVDLKRCLKIFQERGIEPSLTQPESTSFLRAVVLNEDMGLACWVH